MSKYSVQSYIEVQAQEVVSWENRPVPPVRVKPSRMASSDSAMVNRTTELPWPVASMMVCSAPSTPKT